CTDAPDSRAATSRNSVQRRVFVKPGATELTVMPNLPNSLARALVRLCVARLIGPPITDERGSRPRLPEILMTRAWLERLRNGRVSRVMRMRPIGFTRKAGSQ